MSTGARKWGDVRNHSEERKGKVGTTQAKKVHLKVIKLFGTPRTNNRVVSHKEYRQEKPVSAGAVVKYGQTDGGNAMYITEGKAASRNCCRRTIWPNGGTCGGGVRTDGKAKEAATNHGVR